MRVTRAMYVTLSVKRHEYSGTIIVSDCDLKSLRWPVKHLVGHLPEAVRHQILGAAARDFYFVWKLVEVAIMDRDEHLVTVLILVAKDFCKAVIWVDPKSATPPTVYPCTC